MSGPSQPLIRLSTAMPILMTLDGVYEDADAILTDLGLSRASFEDPDAYVHAIIMYQFFEEAAAAIPDQHFLAKIGAKLAGSKWGPLVAAAIDAQTLGSFLTQVVISATEHSSSTEHHLDIAGKSGFIFGKRYYQTPFVPGQIDAFFVAIFGEIIRRCVGQRWSAEDVLVSVSDPAALPDRLLGLKAIKGDRMGHRISFPALWLTLPFDGDALLLGPSEPVGDARPPNSVADSVREALRPHIGARPIDNKSAAQILNMSEQQLSRRLRREGTTIGRLLTELKRTRAEELLREDKHGVTKVADMLGYSDPTSFAHAFRRWTGTSPSEFRSRPK